MINFFAKSDCLDFMVLKPLAHIRPNWELTWDDEKDCYLVEEDSYAEDFNRLIEELENVDKVSLYHENEDSLAEYVINNLHWPITKVGNRWIGCDYASIISQGGFGDFDEQNLLKAAAGRIYAAKAYCQETFDDMERGHKEVLATVITAILYHRS